MSDGIKAQVLRQPLFGIGGAASAEGPVGSGLEPAQRHGAAREKQKGKNKMKRRFIARRALPGGLVASQQRRKIKLINIVSSGTDEKQTAN